MEHDNPLTRRLPLGVVTVVLAVVAWTRRVFESFLLLLPARPAARPTGRAHITRTGFRRREVPVAGE
ncbi:hypothetical protein ACWIG5_27750 [Streptomyces lydicus]